MQYKHSRLFMTTHQILAFCECIDYWTSILQLVIHLGGKYESGDAVIKVNINVYYILIMECILCCSNCILCYNPTYAQVFTRRLRLSRWCFVTECRHGPGRPQARLMSRGSRKHRCLAWRYRGTKETKVYDAYLLVSWSTQRLTSQDNVTNGGLKYKGWDTLETDLQTH
jgi:hypothetical protein